MANRNVAGRKSRPVSGKSPSGDNPATQSSERADSFLSKRVFLACVILIALSVIVYAPLAGFGFVTWDDPTYVYSNPQVAQGLTWQGIQWAFTSTVASNWHPATWLSHMLDVQLYGMNPGPHHITSLVLHILNTLLLFGLLFRMTGAWGRSAFAAGLFALHPLHVESVAWIAERKDVLSTLFWMLTIAAYVAYVRRPRPGRYLLVLALFGLGLMAKPMLVTLPFVLLLLDFWPLQRVEVGHSAGQSALAAFRQQVPGLLRLVREKLPLFALAAVSSAVTVLAQRHGGAVRGLEAVPLGLRLANALAAYLAYIGKMVWPVRLAAFYPLGAATPVFEACLGALLLFAVTVFAVRARRRHGYLLVGWLWYVGTLVPVIGLVQVGDQSMADRYTYVPLIGLFLIAAWGAPELLARWQHGRLALPAAAGCVLLACAALAGAQVRYWSDSAALWQRALAVTEGNYIAHNELGDILMEQGRVEEAIPHFVESLRIKPGFALAQINLGLALMRQGKFDEAARSFGEAVRITPGFAEAHDEWGQALARQGKFDEAIGQYTEAVRLKPDFALAQANLGTALMQQGRFDEAARSLEEALRLKPEFPEAHHRLGNVLARQGRANEAIGQYTEALRLKPDFAEAHNDLGVTLGQQGRLEEAAQHFGEALRLKPGFADAINNLKLTEAMQQKTGQ